MKVLLGTSSCSDCPPERLYRSIVLWRVGARSRPQATKALPPLKKAILETGGLFFKFFLSRPAGGAAIWSRDYICVDVRSKQVSCRLLLGFHPLRGFVGNDFVPFARACGWSMVNAVLSVWSPCQKKGTSLLSNLTGEKKFIIIWDTLLEVMGIATRCRLSQS